MMMLNGLHQIWIALQCHGGPSVKARCMCPSRLLTWTLDLMDLSTVVIQSNCLSVYPCTFLICSSICALTPFTHILWCVTVSHVIFNKKKTVKGWNDKMCMRGWRNRALSSSYLQKKKRSHVWINCFMVFLTVKRYLTICRLFHNLQNWHNIMSMYVPTGPVLYDLYAICNHAGTVNMGHYTACCTDENGWCFYNDSRWGSPCTWIILF